ncbi:MAG: hypothetical protein AAGI48_14925 [Verrucomicrobiota bacterium]
MIAIGCLLRFPHLRAQLLESLDVAVFGSNEATPPELSAQSLRSPQIVSDRVVNSGWG